MGKVLVFVNPPGPRYLYRGTICTYISKARYVWKPKDFILLTSVVPPEWEIFFIDAAINSISKEETLREIAQKNPDVIVCALSSIVWLQDLDFVKSLRLNFANAKIIVFGEVFIEQEFAREVMGYADGLIYDPLRSNLEQMVQARVKTTAFFAPSKKNTQELKTHIPRHALFDNRRYRWPFVKHFRFASIYTQFGCPFSCSYCTESITNVTYRPAENVLQEMEMVCQMGFKELQIGDASFGNPKENALRILEGMIQRRFNFSWSCYTYPGLADENMLSLMAKSGCHTVVIGIDSADGSLLEKYGRHLPQGKIRDFIRRCKEHKIDVCGDLILGFEEDTKESCLKTIELSIELDLDYASFNIATPMMGSSIREQYKQSGSLGSPDTGFDTAGLSRVMGTGHLNPQDLVWLRNYAVRRFYLRPSYILKKLKKARSLEEIFIKINEGYGIILNLMKQKRTLRDGYL